ncbi:MAG: hypothetical protein HYT29_02350 [Parcubacteria group bacterium]|nr:hypothetical protein [Parcubacteria group bacterium]
MEGPSRFRENYENSSRRLEVEGRLRAVDSRIEELQNQKSRKKDEEDELQDLIQNEKPKLERELEELKQHG